jgi:uncharacterized membrane protein YhiD involved in acid resistance
MMYLGPLLAAWFFLLFALLVFKYVTYTDRSEQPMHDEHEESEKDVTEHMANENEQMANQNEQMANQNEQMANQNEVEQMANQNEVEQLANENEVEQMANDAY